MCVIFWGIEVFLGGDHSLQQIAGQRDLHCKICSKEVLLVYSLAHSLPEGEGECFPLNAQGRGIGGASS